MICYVFIFCFFQFLIYFSKNHFLKIHYYRFRLNSNYNLFLDKLKKIEIFLFEILGDFYFYFIFFRKYFMLMILIILFFSSILLFEGNLRLFLVFIPYYGFYQFLLSIYIFLVTKLKIDFEILVMESYFYFIDEIKINNLLVQTNRYTINKFPNDFFSRIKSHKPQI